jgi:hypothetical protein
MFVPDGTKPQKNEEREERIMEFVSGQTKKDVVEISDILTGDYEGRDISMNGAIHTIRDMGEVAFVILRKREGLVPGNLPGASLL